MEPSSPDRRGRIAAAVQRHYSQLLVRKRRRHASRRPADAVVAAAGEALLLSAQPETEHQCTGRSSAVFEQWWPSPVARTSVAVHTASCTCPLLSLLQRCENVRGYVFDQCSIGALHRLCCVCPVLREFSLAYLRERVHRPVVFGGMRRGCWRLADGSSFSDTCCAEELCWGATTSWLPVPSLYSRLRLSDPPGNAGSSTDAATAAWLGAAAAFGTWPSAACVDAVRQVTAELRGYAIAYAQFGDDPIGSGAKDACPQIVIAGGIHVGSDAGSNSRPVAKVVAVSLSCGAVQHLPDMVNPRANFSLVVYPPPTRIREPSSANSKQRSHTEVQKASTNTTSSTHISRRLVILVAVGGVGDLQEPLPSAECFCCSKGADTSNCGATISTSWMQLPSMRTARTHPSAACSCWCTDNGRLNTYRVAVVVVGGLSALGSVLRSTETLSFSLSTGALVGSLSWARGPPLRTGRFGACVVLVQRCRGEGAYFPHCRQQQDGRNADHRVPRTDSGMSDGVMDVLVAGGYSLSSGKLSSVELLDEYAPPPATHEYGQRQRGAISSHGSKSGDSGAFLQLAQLSVARSPWSHCSEGVEGGSNPIVEASGGAAGSAVVFGMTLASAAGREGTVETTPFKSPQRLK